MHKQILLLLFLFFASFNDASAQQAKKISRIGYLSPLSTSGSAASLEAFHQGLRESGYVEGKNIFIEYRWAEGRLDGFLNLQPNWSTLAWISS